MAVDASPEPGRRGALEGSVRGLEKRLSAAVDGHPPLTLTPAWWQQRLLDWATTDPDFRVKLLRFVDVLPTLRDARAIADHVRQYFRPEGRPPGRGAGPGLIETASGLAAQPVFRPVLSQVVRQGVFAMAHRFIAGATPQEALPALRELAGEGVAYTVDLLGEETLSDVEADAYLARYSELIQTLAAGGDTISPQGEKWQGVPPVNISVKLSAVCAHLEPAAPEYVSEVTRARLRPLLRLAMETGAFVNFDMEQYRYKDLVHRAFADLLLEPEFSGYPHLGIVVQAYLRDAEDDIARLRTLAERRGTPFAVRLVKGAYWDEEHIVAGQNSWPVPVYQEKRETDQSFERCTDALLAARPRLRAAFGTHNPRSVAQAIVKARRASTADGDIEFQTLYGMAEGLRTAVAADGYRTRVYVPVGRVIPGMAYLVRRLLENTSNQAWFNARAAASNAAEQAAASRARVRGRSGAPLRPGSGLASGPSRDRAPTPEPARAPFANAAPAPFFEPDARRRMSDAIAAARRGFGAAYPLLIGERRVSDRPHADIVYPAEPDAVIGRVAQATVADVDAAVRAARAAFPAWRDLPAHARGDILRRAAESMERRRFELAATMIFESAKPWHEADGDVIEAMDYLRYYALQAERLSEPQVLGDVPGECSEYFYEGRGVAAIIAPWNFPLAIITGMSVGALAGGNAAILKPAAQSPIIACKLVEILREAGVPPAVVQYLPGPGGQVGRALVGHPDVDNIAFTGSSGVGLGIIEAAARAGPGRRSVKRVIAEMGGKNAIIIDDDADLDQAVAGTLVSAFGYAGQKCSACSRLVIVGSAYAEALERLRHAVAGLVVGPPHDPATFVPPVIGAAARDRIMACIAGARSYATLVVQGDGGSRRGSTGHPSPVAQGPSPEPVTAGALTHVAAGGGGYYVPPTVFTGVPLDSELAREEVFGPVLAVFPARDFEEALDIACDSPFALTGGLFSRNPRHIQAARRRFRVGNLYINRKITGAMVGRQPFGGLGLSGVGEKAGGPDYLRQFMAPRSVTENTTRRGFAPEDAGQV
ncbi:MAG: proline dehydrogenase family protein [Dehalococcoidia bacterium]|nr:proline dehydrogenase family protein [Dehalococcoidia bacterium]